jgi:hypothetical protein
LQIGGFESARPKVRIHVSQRELVCGKTNLVLLLLGGTIKAWVALDNVDGADGPIRIALKFSDMGMKYREEMSDAPLLRPGPAGGNHAMWIAGHLSAETAR